MRGEWGKDFIYFMEKFFFLLREKSFEFFSFFRFEEMRRQTIINETNFRGLFPIQNSQKMIEGQPSNTQSSSLTSLNFTTRKWILIRLFMGYPNHYKIEIKWRIVTNRIQRWLLIDCQRSCLVLLRWKSYYSKGSENFCVLHRFME